MRIAEKARKRAADSSNGTPVVAAFLGDSVTHGCFETFEKEDGSFGSAYDFAAVYHQRLKTALEAEFCCVPFNIINAGVSGNTAAMGAARVAADILPCSPDLAVVCFGLNDAVAGMKALDSYVAALTAIFRVLRSRDIETLFMTPNMMNDRPVSCPNYPQLEAFASKTAELQTLGIMDAYMAAARTTAKENGVTLCDCYADWKALQAEGADIISLLANGINHPSRDMHGLFSSALRSAILA